MKLKNKLINSTKTVILDCYKLEECIKEFLGGSYNFDEYSYTMYHLIITVLNSITNIIKIINKYIKSENSTNLLFFTNSKNILSQNYIKFANIYSILKSI